MHRNWFDIKTGLSPDCNQWNMSGVLVWGITFIFVRATTSDNCARNWRGIDITCHRPWWEKSFLRCVAVVMLWYSCSSKRLRGTRYWSLVLVLLPMHGWFGIRIREQFVKIPLSLFSMGKNSLWFIGSALSLYNSSRHIA